MPSYLWPMTSPYPILAGYRLVMPGPYACLSSMCVQNLLVVHAFAMVGLRSLPFVLDHFPFFYDLTHLGVGLCLIEGFAFFLQPTFFYYRLLPYHSVIPVVMSRSCWVSLGLPFTLSPSGLAWSLVLLLMGSCVPFVFLLDILGPFAFFRLSWPFY